MSLRSIHKYLKTLLVAWLMVFSVADVRALPGLVVCVGQDGHVDLESSEDEKCKGGEAESHGDESAWTGAHAEHCGICLDVPITSKEGPASGMQHSSAVSLSAPPDAFAGYLPEALRQPGLPVEFSILAPRELASIRTVRLLV